MRGGVDGAVVGGSGPSLAFGSAGFDTTSESFTPGLGNGSVVDTDAIRRRAGDDGSEILWSQVSTFLMLGTASGEYIASGGLVGGPITPTSIVVRQLSDYGSADVCPARAHKGLFFVTRGGQAVDPDVLPSLDYQLVVDQRTGRVMGGRVYPPHGKPRGLTTTESA